jgi:hypothetical protein
LLAITSVITSSGSMDQHQISFNMCRNIRGRRCRKLTFVSAASTQTRSDGLIVSHLSKDPSAELDVVSRESSSAGLGRCQVTKDDARSLASTLPPITWNSFNKCESCSCVCLRMSGCPRNQDILKLTTSSLSLRSYYARISDPTVFRPDQPATAPSTKLRVSLLRPITSIPICLEESWNFPEHLI